MHDGHTYILLAEDEPQFIYVMERYANRGGYHLVHTHQEHDIVRLAQQMQPIVIILDVAVPALDIGLVISHLRTDTITRRIPIILCSSSEAALRAWEPEVDACWLKPVLYDDFTLGIVNVRGSRMMPDQEGS